MVSPLRHIERYVPGAAAYLDLIEAVERGAIDGDNALDFPVGLSDNYTVQLSTWARMTAILLERIISDAGSVRRAAKFLDVPRSTLGSWRIRAKRELE